MKANIDHDMKVINLRAKLQFIEAERAKRSNVCKLNKFLARLKYPKTDSGRRRFIQDSVKPDNRHCFKICYCLAILIGIAGMTLSLIWSIEGIDFSGSWMAALLSMALIAIGSCGLSELKKRQS